MSRQRSANAAMTRTLSGASLGAIALFLAAEASAQTQPPPPPQPVSLDENGVDVATRTLVISTTDLAIGPDDHRGLQLNRQLAQHGWRLSSVPVVSGNGDVNRPVIVLNGQSYSFSRLTDAYTYVPKVQDGSKLSSDRKVFTTADGTVIQFRSARELTGVGDANSWLNLAEHVSGYMAASKITFPDGVEHSFTYQRGYYRSYNSTTKKYDDLWALRLISINSSTGYQLKYIYDFNGEPSSWNEYTSWKHLNKVISINNAVEYCAPGADTCTLTGDWPEVIYGGYLILLPSVTDPEGRTTSYTYSDDKLASITPPSSAPVSFTYSGDKVASVARGGGTWTYASTTSGSSTTTTVTDPVANSVVYTSNAAGFVTSRKEGSDVTSFAYCTGTSTCPSGRIARITSPEGNYTTFTYDTRGNLTSQTSQPKPGTGLAAITTSAAYPAACSNAKTCNKPTSTTDAKGNVTTYTWDGSHGGLAKIELPAPASGAARPTTHYNYQTLQARYLTGAGVWSNSSPIWVLDYTRECRTAATCSGSADERILDLNYLANSTANNALPTQVFQKSGNNTLTQTASLTYTSLGDVASVDGPLSGTGDKSVIFYNKARQVTGQIGPGDATYPNLAQRISYDNAGRPWKAESGYTSGQTAAALTSMTVTGSGTTTYDTYGRAIKSSAIGSNGTAFALTQASYDAAGRVTCSVQRMNPASFASPPANACTLATTGSYGPDRITKYTYDNRNRVIKETNGFGTSDAVDTYAVTFTPNGQIKTAKDANNNLTTYDYDGHDRNYKVRFPVATKGANASSTTDYEQYGFDAGGNVTSFRTRRGETLSLSYDGLDRLTRKTVPERSGLAATHTRDVFYAYDLFGNLTDVRFDSLSGEGVHVTYDGLGRQTSESQIIDGVTRKLTSYYDNANNRTALVYPDNQAFTYTYGLGSRPEQIWDNVGNVMVDYSYDSQSRVNRLDRFLSAKEQYMSYDTASRLSGLSIGSSATNSVNATSFTYNPASQIASATKSNNSFAWNAHVDATRSYAANGLNQYTAAGSASFAYDANGNLTSDGTNTYTYDVENRLVSRSGGGTTASLRYDPLGRLYEVNGSATGITRFAYDGDALVAEYNSAGTMIQRYAHGFAAGADDPLISYAGSSTDHSNARLLYADERGSIVYSTNSTGGAATINTYDSYGIPGTGNSGRFQYTGQIWIPEIGMYHYKARAYSPTLGRFMQTDPIGYGDGMNMYRYTANDPINGVDPTGMRRTCVTITGEDGTSYTGCNGEDESPPFAPGPPEIVPLDLPPFVLPSFNDSNSIGAGQDTHDYTLRRDLRCSADNGFEALKDSGAAPFADPIPDGITIRTATILFGQRITQRIDSGSRTVTNVTSPTHYFRHGYVSLTITPTGANSSRLTIRGVGTNVSQFRATLNQLSGPAIFSEVASDIQRKCSIRG